MSELEELRYAWGTHYDACVIAGNACDFASEAFRDAEDMAQDAYNRYMTEVNKGDIE